MSTKLSSSNHCVQHWWHQRISALLSIPLLIWLLFFIKSMFGKSIPEVIGIVRYPWNIVPILLLQVTFFYHAALGMRIVIEDYVTNLCLRYMLIVIVQVFCLTTVISSAIALISLI